MTRLVLLVCFVLAPLTVLAQDRIDAVPPVSGANAPIWLPANTAPVAARATDHTPPEPAAEVPATEHPGGIVAGLRLAIRDRRWMAVAGFALMLCVWVLRKRFASLPASALPGVAVLLASVPALALRMTAPDVDSDEILGGLLMIYVLGNGSWSGLVEPVRNWLQARRMAALSQAVPAAVSEAIAPPAPAQEAPEPPPPQSFKEARARAAVLPPPEPPATFGGRKG